jgi:hypothetical protein
VGCNGAGRAADQEAGRLGQQGPACGGLLGTPSDLVGARGI